MKQGSRLNAADFNEKYPERRGWERHQRGVLDGRDYVHAGYYSELLKPCPVCGRYPVFEEYGEPKVYAGYCPTCELRTRKPGTLKEAVIQWQKRMFSHDSLLVCHRLKPESMDTYGCRMLCDKVVSSAIDDALFYAFQQQDVKERSELWESNRKMLKDLENFFRTSGLMVELDPDGVISDIRRALYPTMKPEDRIKIPLHLADLYKGKEILKKCTQKSNS